MPAFDGTKYLCEDILSPEDYVTKKTLMDPTIFEANYNQVIIRPEGALYKEFKTYTRLPELDGKLKFDRAFCFVDTADKGQDYLCAPMGLLDGNYIYLTDVVYTQDPVEDSLPMVADALQLNGIVEIRVEANSGGSAYARDLQKILADRQYMVYIEEYTQLSNKETRIISNSAAVQDRILMPDGWESRFPAFAWDLMQFLRVGKNRHDDAPDALTGFYEYAFDGGVILA
jgi:predicted phage terminase large subunit-like protein